MWGYALAFAGGYAVSGIASYIIMRNSIRKALDCAYEAWGEGLAAAVIEHDAATLAAFAESMERIDNAQTNMATVTEITERMRG